MFRDPPNDKIQETFVQFIMDPIVEKYNKVFNPEVMANTNSIREAHIKIKERLGKFLPMEDGVLKMVCENLPSPQEA